MLVFIYVSRLVNLAPLPIFLPLHLHACFSEIEAGLASRLFFLHEKEGLSRTTLLVHSAHGPDPGRPLSTGSLLWPIMLIERHSRKPFPLSVGFRYQLPNSNLAGSPDLPLHDAANFPIAPRFLDLLLEN